IQLTSKQRTQAILMLESSFALREIAIKVDCKSHITILRLKEKYKKTGKVENKSDLGHPRKLNERDEQALIKCLMTKECSNTVQL
ncbi:4091_t:CDS:1, partial [Funneliformis geosporum]